MKIDKRDRDILCRSAVFAAAGGVWLLIMWAVFRLYFLASNDPKLPEIMGQTGDVVTFAAFAMIYFRNPFLEKFLVDDGIRLSSALDWDAIKLKFSTFLYDVFSYVFAWHALVAIPMRHDWSGSFLQGYLEETLWGIILVTFFLVGLILIRGYRRAVAQAK